jgi:hypothetical protein
MIMKKIIAFLILLVMMVSCYDEYVVDYDYDGVYFPNPINVRTVVVGEGMKIKVGAEVGGVLENTRDRDVNFIIDNSLVTPAVLEKMKGHSWAWVSGPASHVTTLQALPSDYFTLSDPGKIVIKKGWHSGDVTLKVDSAKFLSNEATIDPVYAVPFYITTADADTILESNRSAIIGLRYENMFFGNYLYGGVTTIKDATGATVETIHYPTKVNQVSEIMALSTVAPHAVVTNGYSINRTGQPEIMLTLNGNNITISSAPGSTNTYEPEGSSSFNGAKLLQERKLFINYKYQEGDLFYHCQDTLSFRNRIRDGVNEWQDENPANYE